MHPAARPASAVLSRVTAALIALAAAVAIVVLPARPAAAASIGPGWGPHENDGLGFIGAFVVGGVQVYCLEPTLPVPLGSTTGPGYGGWGSATPDELARVSWAIATTGQSSDRRDVAAVALYVWSVLAPALYQSHPLPGDAWYGRRVPDPEDRAVVLERLAWLRSEAASIQAVVGPGSGTITVAIDPVDEYVGIVSISGLNPTGAVGTLVLRNGVFDASGTTSIAGVRDGAALAITGVPPAGAAPYRVSVDGSFVVTGAWGGELALWSTPDSQTLAGPGRPVDLVFPLAGADDRDRSVLFQPVVTTVADPRVPPGSRYRDVLRFALGPDAAGRINRWARVPSGEHVPVTASCRVYGPFPAMPVPGSSPPPGAPLASSFVVTTGPSGPGVDYPVESEQPLDAVGWYTTQCSIDAGSQLASTRPYLPAGYRFEDAYGAASENAAVPFLPTVRTAFAERTADPGDRLVDAVTIGIAEGPWLLDAEGRPVQIEVEGRFTVVDRAPQRTTTAPAAAVEVAVQRMTISGPGRYEAEPVAAPEGAGWVVAQWCVLEGPHVRPVCDDWGLPAETVAVEPPPAVPPPVPELAITGSVGGGFSAGAGLALAMVGSGVLLRLAGGVSRRSRRRMRARRRPRPLGRPGRARRGAAG